MSKRYSDNQLMPRHAPQLVASPLHVWNMLQHFGTKHAVESGVCKRKIGNVASYCRDTGVPERGCLQVQSDH